jgi:hypothetical protein
MDLKAALVLVLMAVFYVIVPIYAIVSVVMDVRKSRKIGKRRRR